MKIFLISAFLFLQLYAGAQTNVQLKIVNGVATFEATTEVPALSVERIYSRSLKWLEAAVPDKVITLNTPAQITAKYFQHNADGTKAEHNLQIDIKAGSATFTSTDSKLGLVGAGGKWKEELSAAKASYELATNELYKSFDANLKK
jgi:hypothetical protein